MRMIQAGIALALLMGVSACSTQTVKPADLPEAYRDFAIYTTSQPDPADAGRIVMSMQLVNRGTRHLPTRIVLHPNGQLGFTGGAVRADLAGGETAVKELAFHPPEGLVKQIITGDIYFGGTHARELYIAVRGPDPEGWQPDRHPDLDPGADSLMITDRAQVVATYDPRVRLNWWRHHPSSTVAPDQRVAPLLTLAERGRSDYVIVTDFPADSDPAAGALKEPIADLVRCIKTISGGAELPVLSARPSDGSAIVLRVNRDEDWPHPDAYHLSTNDAGDVVIEAGHVGGVRNGIYGLLTDHLDCHWFMPFELGEEIPQPADQAAIIGQIDEHRAPSFFSSNGVGGVRNRGMANRGRMGISHAWYSLVRGTEEAYEEHPEWFARDRDGNILKFDKGWSWTNFCSTNPEVMKMVAAKLNEQLKNPNVLVASIDPNDYAPFCLCERCTALDASYGADNPDGKNSSDRMIHFANEMYDRLDAENKHKYVGFLVYAYQMQLPTKAVPGKGVAGCICYMDWSYDHTRPINDPTAPSNRKFLRLIEGWGALLPQFGFYDYPTDYVNYGPYGQVMKMREDFPLVRDLGVTFMTIEAQPIYAANGLNHYICGRLLWNVNDDVDVLMEEFFAKYYGPASEPMRRYWLRTEYYTATLRPGPRAQVRMTANPEMWAELDGYLTAAEALVASLPESDKRFRDRVANQRDGFELGRGKARIRAALYQRDGKVKDGALTPENRQMIEDYVTWVDAKRAKYDANAAYWPTMLPGYYFAELMEFINKARGEFEGV